MTCQPPIFVEMLAVIYDKVSCEFTRYEIYFGIIQVVEESRVIESLSSLKGLDPVFDKAFKDFETGETLTEEQRLIATLINGKHESL